MACGPRCTSCEYGNVVSAINNMEGEGPIGSEYLFVASHPGVAEEIELRPLVGEIGKIFDDLLAEAGLIRSQIRIEYAVRCKPSKDPQQKQINACRPWLVQKILQQNPSVIVVMGAIPLKAVTGQAGIQSSRGRFTVITQLADGTPLSKPTILYAMNSPSVVFKRWEDYPVILEDFRRLRRYIESSWQKESLGNYVTLTDVDSVRQYVDYLLTVPRFSFDLETTTYNFWDFSPAKGSNYQGFEVPPKRNILCLSLSGCPNYGAVIPFMGHKCRRIWSREDWQIVKSEINRLFSSNVPKVGQNGAFDINFLRGNGFEFNLDSYSFDTMIAHATIQENLPHDLDFLTSAYTSLPFYTQELNEWKKNNGGIETYADFPEDLLWRYAAADADATLTTAYGLERELSIELTERVDGDTTRIIPMKEFYEEIVLPLNRALIDVEYTGMVLDIDELQRQQVIEVNLETELTQQFESSLGRKINLASSQQLQAALFNPPSPPMDPNWNGLGVDGKAYIPGLGLPQGKKTDGGKPSTNVEVLTEIFEKTKHPILAILMKVRKRQKKISTYLAGKTGNEGMLKFRVPQTGRVYATYQQHVAVTGRLSTRDPAIHNIPDPDKDPEFAGLRELFTVPSQLYHTIPVHEMRKRLPVNFHTLPLMDYWKELFQPTDEKWWLIQADYSQLELRVVAVICQEEVMLRAYKDGIDIHKLTASKALGIPLEEVTAQQRRMAKAINFGIVYGISPWGLADELGITVQEAELFIAKYFATFKGLNRYIQGKKRSLADHGYGCNSWGRKRRLYGYQFLDPQNVRKYGDKRFLESCEWLRKEMERQIVNSGVQASGSDLLSKATILIHQEYRKRKMQSRLVISHHDALYVQTPHSELFQAAHILHKHMTAPYPQMYNTSFPIDLKIGERWEHCDDQMTLQVEEYIKGVV